MRFPVDRRACAHERLHPRRSPGASPLPAAAQAPVSHLISSHLTERVRNKTLHKPLAPEVFSEVFYNLCGKPPEGVRTPYVHPTGRCTFEVLVNLPRKPQITCTYAAKRFSKTPQRAWWSGFPGGTPPFRGGFPRKLRPPRTETARENPGKRLLRSYRDNT